MTLAIINHRLEEDFYERSIGGKCYVLTLYETEDIILKNDFQVHDFIIQELYYITAVYYRTGGIIPLCDNALTHHDIRRCLFDFNDFKDNLSLSLGNATICESCKGEFNFSFTPDNFFDNIEKELKKIKKDKFFIIRDWIRKRPIWSIIIGILLSFFINIFSNMAYDYIKHQYTKERHETINIQKK